MKTVIQIILESPPLLTVPPRTVTRPDAWKSRGGVDRVRDRPSLEKGSGRRAHRAPGAAGTPGQTSFGGRGCRQRQCSPGGGYGV